MLGFLALLGIYSSTKLQVVDVEFELYARALVPSGRPERWKIPRHQGRFDRSQDLAAFGELELGRTLNPRREQDYVFGYGSLLNPRSRAAQASACGLEGFRRTWDVAMDNTKTIPGYKYYVDAVSGDRPALFVTFVNLRPSPGEVVSGVAFPVDRERLAALDRRERTTRGST